MYVLLVLAATGLFCATAGAEELGMRVTRSISTAHALPGSIFQVTLRVEALQDLVGVGVQETLPLGWTIHPVDNAGAAFRRVDGEWVFPDVLSAGTAKTLIYEVAVPAAKDLYSPSLPYCFSIDGTYQATVPSFQTETLGDSEIEVASVLPIPTVIAHLVPGGQGAADQVDLRLSRTLSSAQLERALELWTRDFVVPATGGEWIDRAMIGRLIAHYETCTRVDDPLPVTYDPELQAVRTIETFLPCDSVLLPEGCHDPGASARELTVRVEITLQHDAYGVSLNEWLPTGWRVRPIAHDGFRYRASTAEWVYPSRVRAGEVLTVVYAADVIPSVADTMISASECCGREVLLMGEVASALSCSTTQVVGEDTVTMLSCVPVILALSRWDVALDRFDAEMSDAISFSQMQRAIRFWQEGHPVPHTCGYTVGYETLKQIVSYWLTGTLVTHPLPGESPVVCGEELAACRTANCDDGWLCLMMQRQGPEDQIGLPEPPEVHVEAGPDRIIDCNRPAVQLAAETTGGVEPFRFEWIGPAGQSLGEERGLWVDAPGEYTVIAISCGGCLAVSTVTVRADFGAPRVEAAVSDVLTGFVQEVELAASIEGGTGPFEIVWTSPSGEPLSDDRTVRVDRPGEYAVTVTGSNGCVTLASVEVIQDIEPPAVEIEIAPDAALLEDEITLTCHTQEVSLMGIVEGGRPPYAFAWTNSRGEMLGHESTLRVVSPETYTVTVTGANGIQASVSATVMQDLREPSICLSLSGDLTCIVDEAILSPQVTGGRAPFSYHWTDEDGCLVETEDLFVATQPGRYTLTVVGENGCSNSMSVEVKEDRQPPALSVVGDLLLTCSRQTTDLSARITGGRPPYEIAWFDGAEDLLGDEQILRVSSPGTYAVRVIGANGCRVEDTVVVEQDVEAPNVQATVDGTLQCSRKTVSLHANITGGRLPMTIQWTDEDGAVLGGSALLEVSAPGCYTVTVTGGNGCSVTDSVTVLEDLEPPTVSAEVSGPLSCATTAVEMVSSVTGGRAPYLFEWIHSDGHVLGCGETQRVTEPGQYTLIVQGANGCSSTLRVSVEEDIEAPTVKAFVSGLLTCATPQVELTACPTGGRAPYVIEWADAEGRAIGTSLEQWVDAPGAYTVTVTGENGCSGTADVVVLSDTEAPTIDVCGEFTLTCDEPTVRIDPQIHGGRSPYTYAWTDDCGVLISTARQVELDFPGVYTVTVTGANGCSSTVDLNVLDGIEPPTVDAGPDRTLACIGDSLTLTATVTGGQSPYQYTWVNACNEVVGTCPDLIVSAPGIYIVTVTAADGCVGMDSVTVHLAE
jgi:PKD repeat protein